MLDFLNNEIVASVIKSIILIFILLTIFAYMTLIERVVLARMQGRLGPNRAGPFGMFQPLADAIKMAFKEQLVPAQAKKFIYMLAPVISIVVALSAFAVIPIGMPWSGDVSKRGPWDPFIGDVNIGLLWLLAMSSLAVYGIVLGGWSSGNRYSLLGALRSAAQMVSYETSMGLALGGILMFSGTLSMVGIVQMQRDMGIWFVVAQPLGFVIYAIAGVAEVNRAPFDLPEAEQELTAGYLTEYAGLRWSLYQMSEYINMITVSAVASTLFFGGWSFFGLENIAPILSVVFFVIKVAFFLFIFMWLRATLPRIRYDRLMMFGWQFLLPLAALNAVITATTVALHLPWFVSGIAGLLVIVVVLFLVRRYEVIKGLRFEEDSKKGKLVLPATVRLVKFEASAPSNGSTEKDTTPVQV
ncbi:NADH-quinone oxidoreductase subunit H [Thermosporothrix hazakensis]|jgi:NADH-quinone oxidoreductase subunit H|uniref:NADH-quinone oxidoreductase subunit H n=1 Tax=Thermosporothrix hazakensis TaxID=644383 RepID=A0A326U1A8_THEHA|nr:NADH-quinone oxidoreductase subunit NuoH [Thermosporothrix hazakensis]PZW23415.1 NADH-quinone oxidoreductase subunit H [Thermosporothrix hazakensis]GCE47950.1 NADH-quinone oxidoreductase subunit 8 [Thermosporothrix hazakensis]